jgi:hypothetical protein
MCLQYIQEFSSPLFTLALPVVSFTYWPGKVLVLADTLSRCLEGLEYEPSSEIPKQMAELIPPVEVKPGDRMSHEDFIKFLLDPAKEDSVVDLWFWKRKVPQPKETFMELLTRIQKEPAEQQLMRSMLGGFSQVDHNHPVWADVLEIPNITKVKLCMLRDKFLPKGMEEAMTVMTEEARTERNRKPEDGLGKCGEAEIKAGTVLHFRGKLNFSSPSSPASHKGYGPPRT